jgi:hypothetical protein
MKKIITLAIIIITAITFFSIGKNAGQGNQVAVYGSSGSPKNCRALISENIKGFRLGNYSAEEALGSIERNCGSSGYIWNER